MAEAQELRQLEANAWARYRVALAGGSPDANTLRAAWVDADDLANRAERPHEFCPATSPDALHCGLGPTHGGPHKAWPGGVRPGRVWHRVLRKRLGA